MELRALIFDVDGTLADTEEVHRRAFNAAFAEHGLTWNWGRRVYGDLLKTAGGKERILEFVSRLHLPPSERDRLIGLVPATSSLEDRFTTDVSLESGAELRPGIARLLRRGTGGRTEARRRDHHDTDERRHVSSKRRAERRPAALFDVIAAGDVVRRKKPAPDIYHHALACLGVPAGACIAFEDSAIGLRAAKEAGLFTVVTPTEWTKRDDFKRADVGSMIWARPADLHSSKKVHSACSLKTVQAA